MDQGYQSDLAWGYYSSTRKISENGGPKRTYRGIAFLKPHQAPKNIDTTKPRLDDIAITYDEFPLPPRSILATLILTVVQSSAQNHGYLGHP